jgi:hypothetical protein
MGMEGLQYSQQHGGVNWRVTRHNIPRDSDSKDFHRILNARQLF